MVVFFCNGFQCRAVDEATAAGAANPEAIVEFMVGKGGISHGVLWSFYLCMGRKARKKQPSGLLFFVVEGAPFR